MDIQIACRLLSYSLQVCKDYKATALTMLSIIPQRSNVTKHSPSVEQKRGLSLLLTKDFCKNANDPTAYMKRIARPSIATKSKDFPITTEREKTRVRCLIYIFYYSLELTCQDDCEQDSLEQFTNNYQVQQAEAVEVAMVRQGEYRNKRECLHLIEANTSLPHRFLKQNVTYLLPASTGSIIQMHDIVDSAASEGSRTHRVYRKM